jgi:hypothetical protein
VHAAAGTRAAGPSGARGLPERHPALLELLVSSPPLSYEEIGARFGMPVGSIGPTRARALAWLGDALEAADFRGLALDWGMRSDACRFEPRRGRTSASASSPLRTVQALDDDVLAAGPAALRFTGAPTGRHRRHAWTRTSGHGHAARGRRPGITRSV